MFFAGTGVTVVVPSGCGCMCIKSVRLLVAKGGHCQVPRVFCKGWIGFIAVRPVARKSLPMLQSQAPAGKSKEAIEAKSMVVMQL